jgi:hypothetical protein
MVLVWSGKGKILKEIMLRKGEKMKPLFVGGYDYTGVVGLALYDGNSSGKLIAKRTLFAGYSNLARANIDIADSIFYNEANYIRISHTDKLWAKFSLSIIEESNIRLMETRPSARCRSTTSRSTQ